jgi:hypothetical protein
MSEEKQDYGNANIVRVKKDVRYFAASNVPFNDTRLSWGARGLMGYLLSKPDNWQVRVTDLEKQSKAGEKAIRRILAELRLCGYINRIRIKKPDGLFTWTTEIYEDYAQNPNPQKSTSYLKRTSGERTSAKQADIVSTDQPSTEKIGANPAPVLTIENQIYANASKVVMPSIDDWSAKRDIAAMQIIRMGADLEPLAVAAMDALKIIPAKREVKGWAMALREMRTAGVSASIITQAAQKLRDSGMTVADPFGLKKTAIVLAAQPLQPQRIQYIPEPEHPGQYIPAPRTLVLVDA